MDATIGGTIIATAATVLLSLVTMKRTAVLTIAFGVMHGFACAASLTFMVFPSDKMTMFTFAVLNAAAAVIHTSLFLTMNSGRNNCDSC